MPTKAPPQGTTIVEPGPRLDTLLSAIGNALWAINDQLKPIDNAINNQTEDITKWLGLIVEAIDRLASQTPQPQPKPKGVIMADFQVGASNPDIQINLNATDFKDDEGNAVSAEDIDLSVESSNPDAVTATLASQTLSDDKLSVAGIVDVHFGAPATDVATVTYRATNRDTSMVVAAGSDNFIVVAGEATIGTVTSSVPLPGINPL